MRQGQVMRLKRVVLKKTAFPPNVSQTRSNFWLTKACSRQSEHVCDISKNGQDSPKKGKIINFYKPRINVKSEIKSPPQVKNVFTFALWLSTFRDSFKLVQRAFCGGSATFSEMNLVPNYCNLKSKNKSDTSRHNGKNQILSLQENSLVFIQTITSSFV